MILRNITFWYEGLATLSKNEVSELFQKYLDENENEYDSIDEMFECLYDEGCFDLGGGFVTVVTEIDGCPEELRDEVE